MNKKLPFIFGNLLINAQKEGELNSEHTTEDFIAILRCPITNEKLVYDEKHGLLINSSKTYGYKYFDGIPILLKDNAVKL